ncbi:MAG: peptidoglycan-binding domain-containing protein [Verrucomicrobiota bacterium]
MKTFSTPALIAFCLSATLCAQEEPAAAPESGTTQEPGVARAVPVMERDVTTQLQIFLDQQLFGPGKIDGRPGEFVTKALIRYQRANKLPETGKVDENIPLDTVFPLYLLYTIGEGDLKFVGDSPSQPSAQAKKKYLPYESLLEFLTERFHCAPEFLVKLNKGKNLERLKPGDVVRVPNVEPFKIEELPKQGFLPEISEFKNRLITVRRKDRGRQADRQPPHHARRRQTPDASRQMDHSGHRHRADFPLG